MSEQPPVQPPNQPPHQPSNQPNHRRPARRGQPTDPADVGCRGPRPLDPLPRPRWTPVATRHTRPQPNMWHRATSTNGRRWGLAIGAVALACLLFIGVGVAGLVILRNHDRVNLLGNRQDGHSLGQNGPGNGRGLGNGGGPGQRPGSRNDGQDRRNVPGMPGMPGGRAQGPGGLGNLLGGTALHGDVTATANGSVQALVFQRGEVTAVSDTSITLKSSDGFVGTYGRTAATSSRGRPSSRVGRRSSWLAPPTRSPSRPWRCRPKGPSRRAASLAGRILLA